MTRLVPAAALLLLAAPALAQTVQPGMTTNGSAQPSMTGPAPAFNQPQALQNMSNQPPNVRQAGPTGSAGRTGDAAGATKPQGAVSGNSGANGQARTQQMMSQPTLNQNQSQAQQNMGQEPPNVRVLPPSAATPTGQSAGATKPQGPVTGAGSRAQANRPAGQ